MKFMYFSIKFIEKKTLTSFITVCLPLVIVLVWFLRRQRHVIKVDP